MTYIKKIAICISFSCICNQLLAQIDSTRTNVDTIRVGGMVIIKKGKGNDHTRVTLSNKRKLKKNSVSTSSLIIDLGFANWTDKTDYTAATSQQYLVSKQGQPALGSSDFKLRTGKSSNVNIWFFMQRFNLVKHYVNLKYGFGLELNNYRFSSPVSYKLSGVNPYSPGSFISHPFVIRDSINFTKDKLAADYATIPLMINFRSNPNSSNKGISASAGVSLGYLYSSRNKEKSSERGKQKNHGDSNLQPWKFSYIGELGLGPVHFYGAYAPNSIFDGLFKMMPYTIGFRLSDW